MPIRMPAERSAKTTLAISLLAGSLLIGCTSGDSTTGNTSPSGSDVSGTDDSIESAANLAAKGVEPDVGKESFSASQTPLPDSAGPSADASQSPRASADGSPAPMPPDSPTGFQLAESTPTPAGVPDMAANPGDRVLRDDLTVADLMKALENSDRDMETIASGRAGISDPNQASEMMQQIAKIKLQASIQLQGHSDSTPDQRVDGMRGQLQSLSHLSAMGDVASANALETLAKKNLKSDEPTIAGDSRIVLIGFAIDALRSGADSAGNEIVSLVEGMQENPNSDLPAVLIMAQARQVLSSYGLVDEAARVRTKILELYGSSSNATIAEVAANAAGTAKFDTAQRLLSAILENDQVALERWTDASMELIADSPDMNTVQFLARSALQLEAAGRQKFVEETFSVLKEQFDDPESATATEVATAQKAMEARKAVIGTDFDFQPLPTVEGAGVTPSAYEGKIVLMPFWAISFPESLQMVPMIKEIQQAHPDLISIVGMNLDPEQAPLRELLAQGDMGFPSYRSISSPSASVANPVAARFGLVSLPFVAIFNQQGKVEALDFTGKLLKPTVDRLVEQSK